jgi:hypothetical protein
MMCGSGMQVVDSVPLSLANPTRKRKALYVDIASPQAPAEIGGESGGEVEGIPVIVLDQILMPDVIAVPQEDEIYDNDNDNDGGNDGFTDDVDDNVDGRDDIDDNGDNYNSGVNDDSDNSDDSANGESDGNNGGDERSGDLETLKNLIALKSRTP